MSEEKPRGHRDNPIILRRLKTREGFVSPIEEIAEYRPVHYVPLESRMAHHLHESRHLSDGTELPTARLSFYEKRRVYCILLDMEEKL